LNPRFAKPGYGRAPDCRRRKAGQIGPEDLNRPARKRDRRGKLAQVLAKRGIVEPVLEAMSDDEILRANFVPLHDKG